MTKIGKLNQFLLLLTFSLLNFIPAFAQDVQVEATLSETNIFAGEQVKLELNISGTSMGSVQQPELPEFDGLRWLRGAPPVAPNMRSSTENRLLLTHSDMS